jgi:hypothetical protein
VSGVQDRTLKGWFKLAQGSANYGQKAGSHSAKVVFLDHNQAIHFRIVFGAFAGQQQSLVICHRDGMAHKAMDLSERVSTLAENVAQ